MVELYVYDVAWSGGGQDEGDGGGVLCDGVLPLSVGMVFC
jgi:hypothetical protein